MAFVEGLNGQAFVAAMEADVKKRKLINQNNSPTNSVERFDKASRISQQKRDPTWRTTTVPTPTAMRGRFFSFPNLDLSARMFSSTDLGYNPFRGIESQAN